MLRLLFFLAILIPGIFLAFRSRYAALLLYLWFAFFRPIEWLWVDLDSLRLSFILSLLFVLPAVLTGKFPNVTKPLSVGMLLFLGTGLLAQFNPVNAQVGWNWIDFFARLTLTCLLMVTLVTTPQQLIGVIAVVGLSFGFYGAKAGLMSMMHGGVRYYDGLAGSFADNNGYALGTVMVIPFIIATGQNARLVFRRLVDPFVGLMKIGCYIAVPLCAYTVISTFSRAGFLALVTAAAAFVLASPRRLWWTGGLAVAAIIGISYIPLPSGYTGRLETIHSDESQMDDSSLSRLHFWEVAVVMANARPLGVGMRNYEFAYDQYDTSGGQFGTGRQVHSSHFEVLADQGYAGALVWIGQFVCAFWILIRILKRVRSAGLSPPLEQFFRTTAVALGVSMVSYIVGSSFIALSLNELTWITFGMVTVLDRLSVQAFANVRAPVEALDVAVPAGLGVPAPASAFFDWMNRSDDTAKQSPNAHRIR